MNYTKSLLLSLGMIFSGQLITAGGGGLGQELFQAAANNNEAKVKELIGKGADINWQDANSSGLSVLMVAVRTGNSSMVKDLLAAGANPNARDEYNESALYQAVIHAPENMQGDDIIEELLKNGANIDDADRSGRTPLMVAAKLGRAGFAKLLVDNGANVYAKDERGNTPLEYAISSLKAMRDRVGEGEFDELPQALNEALNRIDEYNYIIKLLISKGAK